MGLARILLREHANAYLNGVGNGAYPENRTHRVDSLFDRPFLQEL